MSLEDISNGNIDIYAFLGVDSKAEQSEIKRQYRRKALEFHPDKNTSSDAAIKFQQLSHIYNILSDQTLRSEYDRIRQIKLDKEASISRLSQETRRFKEQLEEAESQYKQRHRNEFSDIWDDDKERNLDILKEEGYRMRRELERQLKTDMNKSYESYRSMDLGVDVKFDDALINDKGSLSNYYKCILRWKYKPEVDEMINEEILVEIMSVFGPVIGVSRLPNTNKARYSIGYVEYKDIESAKAATTHNYKASAKLWDNTRVRKISSLLRECKLMDGIHLHQEQSPINDDSISKIKNQIQNHHSYTNETLLIIFQCNSELDFKLKSILEREAMKI